jgi:two-component system sensor histidine kinase UhpB
MKNLNKINILLVEDNIGDVVLITEYLRLSNLPINDIIVSDSIAAIEEKVKEKEIHVILLDLSLRDSSGEASVVAVAEMFPKVTLIVLSGLDNMHISINAIKLGAQDYLIKGDYDEKMISKSIQFSLERKRILELLRENDEKYNIVVNKATNDIVWDWDIINDKMERADGINQLVGCLAEEVGTTFDWINKYMPKEDLTRVNEKVKKALDEKIENWQDEYRIIRPDGEVRYILDRGFIMYNEKGNPYRMIGSMTDLTKIRKLEAKISDQKINEQKIITETTIEAQENEKTKLGRELHDNISQLMATVKIYLSIAKNNFNAESLELIEKSYEYINIAIDEVRKLSHSLVSPSLGDITLQEALMKITDNMNEVGKIKFDLQYQIEENIEIDNQKELTIYRIVQEQINNIQKYSKCRNVTINIRSQGSNITLSIEDDGVGFDSEVKPKGIGMRNIKSRVDFYSGTFNIISSPGNGCRLEVTIPA